MSGGRHPSLLLVSFEQFGYHIDTYQYCRYLRDRYRITYLCPDQGLPRKELSGVEIVYSERPPFGRDQLGLFRSAHQLMSERHFAVAFLRRTRLSALLRVLHPRIPMIYDVRTGSIEETTWKRGLDNALVPCNAAFFRHVTVISTAVGRQLRLPARAHVLPLGAEAASQLTQAPRDELKLLYVGTFANRHIHRTVEGLAKFVARRGHALESSYTIVGFGSESERQLILQAALDGGISERVHLVGRVDHDELSPILTSHNVGVAFTPRVPWFEHQPSTKIYEYLQHGLLCIATDNAANRQLVTSETGVLIEDTAAGFCSGLEAIADRLPLWRSDAVAGGVHDQTWERIVNENLEPYLRRVCRRR